MSMGGNMTSGNATSGNMTGPTNMTSPNIFFVIDYQLQKLIENTIIKDIKKYES